jgi:hypothetical protein
MRKLMNRDELKGHETASYGRDYSESDDGYSDMEAEERRGWTAIPNWGRDGWDLGAWPFVMIYTRDYPDGTPEGRSLALMQIVEGDRTVWRFDAEEDRLAAIDYLFLWYAADKHWAPITVDQRDMLDAGYPLAISDKWRGPYRDGRVAG